MKMELRSTQTSLKSNGDLVVQGYVNQTDSLSELLGTTKKFREKIAPGAFKRAIESRKRDIDFLAEHDNKKILASTRNGSLELREDDKGLFMSATITPTTWGQDTYELISSGLVSNMSFGFRTLKDSWQYVKGVAIRTIEQLELFEVSVVKEPAYTQSSIAARGIDLIEEVQIPKEISEHSNKTEERGDTSMEMKIEKRTNDSFETELRNLNTTANGSALIPENVQGEIIKKMEEVSPAFSQARKLPSVAGSLKVAKESDSVTGGFFGEGEEILQESINFEHVELNQKRLGAAASLSNQLINDSAIDIVAYVNDLLGRRVAKTAENAIFNGDGVNEFTGIMEDTSVEAKQVSGAVTIDELVDLYTALHPSFLDGSAFYMSRSFFNQAVKLKDANGHFYMQNGIVNGKPTYTLFGQPVYVTEALADGTVVGEVPVVFANLSEAYSIMVKKEMEIRQVVDSANALRGTKLLVLDGYMDGAVVNPQAIVKLEVTA